MDCYFMSKKGLALSLPPQYGQYIGAAALQMLVCRRLERVGEAGSTAVCEDVPKSLWDCEGVWIALRSWPRAATHPAWVEEVLSKRMADAMSEVADAKEAELMRVGHLPAIKEEPCAPVEAARSLLSPAATPWVGVIPPEAMVLEPWQSSERVAASKGTVVVEADQEDASGDSCRHVRIAHSNTEPVLPWLWTTKLTPLPVVSSAAAVRAGASNREVREIVEAESEREEQLTERAEWREWARLHLSLIHI